MAVFFISELNGIAVGTFDITQLYFLFEQDSYTGTVAAQISDCLADIQLFSTTSPSR